MSTYCRVTTTTRRSTLRLVFDSRFDDRCVAGAETEVSICGSVEVDISDAAGPHVPTHVDA